MAKSDVRKLTVREAAERLGSGVSTLTLWCREGRFPNAEQIDTPRGAVWYIPETDLEGVKIPGRGRPPKRAQDEKANGAGKKRGRSR